MNVVESLSKATGFLDKHDIKSPRLNAELLLAHILRLSRVELYTSYDRNLSETEADRFKVMLMQRSGGYPLQYLTCEAGFRSQIYEVRQGAFIPRPETESLVEKALGMLPDDRPVKVLDVGTGVGNIAISIALECVRAQVLASDVNAAALVLCDRNAQKLGVSDRVRTVPGDLYEPAAAGELFDLIISNPPYIDRSEADALDFEVREFEPPDALFAGGEGLAVIERLVADARDRLVPGGILACEIGDRQGPRVRALFESAGFSCVELSVDLAERDRVATGRSD